MKKNELPQWFQYLVGAAAIAGGLAAIFTTVKALSSTIVTRPQSVMVTGELRG